MADVEPLVALSCTWQHLQAVAEQHRACPYSFRWRWRGCSYAGNDKCGQRIVRLPPIDHESSGASLQLLCDVFPRRPRSCLLCKDGKGWPAAHIHMADNETAFGDSARPLNPIACSHCRQRKRKVRPQSHVPLLGQQHSADSHVLRQCDRQLYAFAS
jgi:hypothetical protein